MLHPMTNRSQLLFFCLGLTLAFTACEGSDEKGVSEGTGGTTATTGNTNIGGVLAGGTTTNGITTGGTTTSLSNSAVGGTSTAGSTGATPEPACAAAAPEEGFVDVDVNNPNIRYVGRVHKTPESVAFAFPAVQIQTVFEGDGIDMRLRDYGSGTAVAANYYWIIIDGEAKKLQVCPAREVYPLARNLGSGSHTLTIVKRTESGPNGQVNKGKGEFLGLRVRPGTVLNEVAKPARLMEFVGDSITCGYGNEVSTTDPDSFKFTAVNEDGWNAYGALTARAFDADYVAVAASGRGVIRNYSDFSGSLVPEIYETTLHEDSAAPAWDHSSYSPDVVVVNLGTNDFSPGIELDDLDAHNTEFTTGYIDFLARIREVHTEASIIAVVGPMMSNSYPTGYNAWTSVQADVIAAVEARHAANDTNVHYFALAPQTSPYGEDWHPTLATHQKMSDALVTFITDVKGW